jgi:hypothetical protein
MVIFHSYVQLPEGTSVSNPVVRKKAHWSRDCAGGCAMTGSAAYGFVDQQI